MIADLAAAIRHHVGEPGLANSANATLLAVVDKCEQMRAESGERGVGHFIAAEFERVIADALGITN